MCITPNITTCNGNISDGTKIIYKSMPNKDCNHPHMLFTYGQDGTLTHHCSGKKVCPSADGGYWVISSTCASDEVQYTRTQVFCCYFIIELASGYHNACPNLFFPILYNCLLQFCYQIFNRWEISSTGKGNMRG